MRTAEQIMRDIARVNAEIARLEIKRDLLVKELAEAKKRIFA